MRPRTHRSWKQDPLGRRVLREKINFRIPHAFPGEPAESDRGSRDQSERCCDRFQWQNRLHNHARRLFVRNCAAARKKQSEIENRKSKMGMRAWRDSNPEPSDPKFRILTSSVMFCNVPICTERKAIKDTFPADCNRTMVSTQRNKPAQT